MNLYEKISEVRNHIDKLQETANKHKENGKVHSFKIICEIINDHKIHLKTLQSDVKKNSTIILYDDKEPKPKIKNA